MSKIKSILTQDIKASKLIVALIFLLAASLLTFVYVQLFVIMKRQDARIEDLKRSEAMLAKAAYQKRASPPLERPFIPYSKNNTVASPQNTEIGNHVGIGVSAKPIKKVLTLNEVITPSYDKSSEQHESELDKAKYIAKYKSAPLLENDISVLAAQQSLKPFSFYIGSRWNHRTASTIESEKKRYGIRSQSYDLKGGRDLLSIGKASDVTFDGINLRNIEMFNLINGEKNKFYVLTPGLAGLNEGALEISGDVDLDKVVLDGCLDWSENQADDKHRKFTAKDIEGSTRDIHVEKHVDIVIDEKCITDYKTLHHIVTAENLSIKGKEEPDDKTADQDQFFLERYTPDKQSNLEIYAHWANGYEDLNLRRNLKLLTTIMEKTDFPTEFLRGTDAARGKYFVENLYFSPKSSSIITEKNNRTCRNTKNAIPQNASSIVVSTSFENSSYNCSHGNQIYSLSDANDKVDDSHGDDIFFPGKGVDVIDTGWGQDIVVLEQNWGKKTIQKTCHGVKIDEDATFHSNVSSRAAFTGVGIRLSVKKEGIFVMGVLPSSPAEKAGLKKGDIITTLSGLPVDAFTQKEIINTMRGDTSKTLDIKYLSHPSGELKEAKLNRGVIDFSDMYVNSPKSNDPNADNQILFDWPYTYNSFVVFGPGIHKDDLIEKAPRQWVHKDSGDSLTVPECVSFFFAGDIDFEFELDKEILEASKIAKSNSDKASTPKTTIEDYKKIPKSMLSSLRTGNTSQRFLRSLTQSFVSHADDNNIIDSSYIDDRKEEEIKKAKRHQISKFINYDDDLDGNVTKAEAKRFFENSYQRINDLERKYDMVQKATNEVMAFDIDQNGIVTREEMVTLNDEAKKASLSRIDQMYSLFLPFDTNEDDKVTYTEFKEAMERIYATVDTDGDDNISNSEYNILRTKMNELPPTQKVDHRINTPTQYPASVRTAIIRMMVKNATQKDELLFDRYNDEKTYAEVDNYVFHPLGGSARYSEPNPYYLEKDKSPKWIFSSSWQIQGIGTDKKGLSSNEIIAFLPYISHEACIRTNLQLGIEMNAIDNDGDGIPKGSKNDILPKASHSMTQNNPGIKTLIDVIGQGAFIGKPFGCFDLSDDNEIPDDGPYVYYHTLIEQ